MMDYKYIPGCLVDYIPQLAYLGLVAACFLGVKLGYGTWVYLKCFVFSRLFGLGTDLKSQGEWAVVTGATDGIGKAYARELARKGINIVLISRTEQKLVDCAKELEGEFGVKTKVIVTDFAQSISIYDNIEKNLKGLNIGVLVNNVGLSPLYPEKFHELADMQNLIDTIQVNCFSIVMMTRIVLPRMAAKRKGVIINNASSSAFLPAPTLAVYSATKAFADFFSRCIEAEVRDTGVIVQGVLPYLVSTKMVGMNPSFLVPAADTFVRAQLATLGIVSRTAGCWIHELMAIGLTSLHPRVGEKLFMIVVKWIDIYKRAKGM